MTPRAPLFPPRGGDDWQVGDCMIPIRHRISRTARGRTGDLAAYFIEGRALYEPGPDSANGPMRDTVEVRRPAVHVLADYLEIALCNAALRAFNRRYGTLGAASRTTS